jgi:hypothetical protein
MVRVLLATALVCALAAAPSHATCGGPKRAPANGEIGVAPLAIGDSVMIDAARSLTRVGFEVDAKCGRSPEGGLFVLRRRRDRGTLPHKVVLALGTNWWVTSGHIRRARRIIGPRRTLFLVTPYRSWRPVSNGPMRRAARRRRRVRLVDWSSVASGHTDWFQSDGTHLRRSGVRAYTRLLKRRVGVRTMSS